MHAQMTQANQDYFDEIIALLKEKNLDKREISRLKKDICQKRGIHKIPKDMEILMQAKPEDIPLLRKRLKTKPVRSISGVSPVAVMTEPRKCPHGTCTFCPGGPKSVYGDVPQSYTGKEPATMRGIRNDFDGYLQVMNRLEYYTICGHMPDKIELIVMGGTFPSYETEYQDNFIRDCLLAMNDFGRMFYDKNGSLKMQEFKDFFELPADVTDKERIARLLEKMRSLKKNVPLAQAQRDNENALMKCIGMTIETRPIDMEWQTNQMLKLGATRVELGIQSVYDEPLKKTNRGHTVADSIAAMKMLKDAGFKINAHIMPGLPGVSYEEDVAMFDELFKNPVWRPDMMKIYPCMVMPGTALYMQYKAGKFTPMSTETAIALLAEVKPKVPRYVRIMRVQRDIPTFQTEAGVDRTSIRQDIHAELRKRGVLCACIRCREIKESKIQDPKMHAIEYDASEGKEFFISFDNADDTLIGFCRLRLPSGSIRPEIDAQSAIIRELHVNGKAVAVGKQEKDASQHKGFGRKLLAKAEEIAKEHERKKMIIISGIGVRNYYRKFGYELEGPYMTKAL
jgi:elongator complex protein 3